MSDHPHPPEAHKKEEHPPEKTKPKEGGGETASSIGKYAALLLAVAVPSCIGGQVIERTQTGRDLTSWQRSAGSSNAPPKLAPVTINANHFKREPNKVTVEAGKRPAGYWLSVQYKVNGKTESFREDKDECSLPDGYADLQVRFVKPDSDPPLATPYVKVP